MCALTTLMPDGAPQTSAVWCDFDGEYVRVNTMRGFAKERYMRADPRVTLLCYDPRDPSRSLEVRGLVVEMTTDGAAQHLDALASKYAGRPVRYFGDVIDASFAATEVPVLCRIQPIRSPRPRCPEVGLMTAPMAAPCVVQIPASHRDLFERAICGVLTTLGPDGHPQSSLVWVDQDSECARVNTTLECRTGRNIVSDRRVSLLVVDPEDTARFIQIRGEAELRTVGALQHLDALTRRYAPHPCFDGHVHPLEQQARETRVMAQIHARRITIDAIHA